MSAGFGMVIPDIVARLRLDTTDGINAAQQDANAGGKKFSKALGAGMIAGVAAIAAAGALLGAAASEAMQREAANFKLKAKLGLNPAEFKRYGKISGGLFNNGYGETADELNTVIAGSIRNIPGLAKANDKVVASTVGQLSSMAEAFDTDAVELSRTVGTMLRTGMAKNAQQAFNVLTRGFQTNTNSADDLLETFNEYPTQFRKLGLDGKTATGLLSQGLNAGARDADTVADSLKEFSIRSIDMSKTSQEGYKAIGLDAAKMSAQIAKGGPAAKAGLGEVLNRLKAIKDPIKREAAAVGLFGTKAEDMGKALYALDLDTVSKDMGKFGGATKQVDKDMSAGLLASITRFKRTAQSNLINFIMVNILPTLTKWVDAIGPVLKETRKIAAEFGGKAMDGARKFFGVVSKELTPVLKDYAATVRTDVLPVVESLARVFIDRMLPVFKRVGGILKDDVLPIFGMVAGFITNNLMPAVWPFVRIIGTNLIKGLQGFARELLDKVGPALGRLKDTLVKNRKPIGDLVAGIARFAGVVGVVVSWIAKHLLPILGKLIGFIAGTAIDIITAFIETIAGVVKGVQKFARWLADASLAVEAFVYKARDKFQAFKDSAAKMWAGVKEKGNDAKQWFKDLPGKIMDAIKGLSGTGEGSLYQRGIDMVQGLMDGLVEKAKELPALIKDKVTGHIPKAVRDALDINSPSRVMMTLGGYTAEGLAVGIAGGAPRVASAAGTLAAAAARGVSVPGSAPHVMAGAAGLQAGGGSTVVNNTYQFPNAITSGNYADQARTARALSKNTERF